MVLPGKHNVDSGKKAIILDFKSGQEGREDVTGDTGVDVFQAVLSAGTNRT